MFDAEREKAKVRVSDSQAKESDFSWLASPMNRMQHFSEECDARAKESEKARARARADEATP